MINNFIDPATLDVILRLFVALLLGMVIGTERRHADLRASGHGFGSVCHHFK